MPPDDANNIAPQPLQTVEPIETPIQNDSKTPLILIGALQLIFFQLAYSMSTRLTIGANEESFRGVSGLALGLVVIPILGIFVSVVVALVCGLALKRLHYAKPYPIAFLASFMIYLMLELLSGTRADIPPSIVLPLSISLGALSYLVTFLILRKERHARLTIVFIFVLLIGVNLALRVLHNVRYFEGRKQEIVNKDFTLYAPDSSFFNKHSITNSSDIQVVFATTEIKTPKGKIRVRQAAIDDNLSNLFIPPSSCDHGAINEYVNTWGKRDVQSKTEKKCTIVYEATDRLVMMAYTNSSELLDGVPFVAKIDNTIIVFHAYGSTYGEFDGSYEEAESYVIEYVKNARAIENSEIGL